MKIGKINRLAKAGEMVSVRLPNGKTISAKAGNDLNSTTVLVSKTQSGWFAFSSQGETKTTSTQVINRRPRQVTPEIYPIKVLFSIEFSDKFEFYIGGDRNVPIKIWELEKFNNRTKIISAAINSTGNKKDNWIVMIQYSGTDLAVTAPNGQTFNNLNPSLNDVEASVILRPNLSPVIHVGANGSDPIGNGFFAPRDPYVWYFFEDQADLKTGEDYRSYSFIFSATLDENDLAIPSKLSVSRPWLYNESFQGNTTTSYSELWLYNYQPDWDFLSLGTQVGTNSTFGFLNEVYGPDPRPFSLDVEASVFIADIYVPSVGAHVSLFPLYWDEIEFLEPASISALLNVLCPNFFSSIMAGGLTVQATNLVAANYMAEFSGTGGANQAFDHELLQSLNLYNRPYGLAGQAPYSFLADVQASRQSFDTYGSKITYLQNKPTLNSYGNFATAFTEYNFNAFNAVSTGTFNYTIVSLEGIERIQIPYDLTAIEYRQYYDNEKIFSEENISIVKKISASGNMQMMGITFDVDVKQTYFAVEARLFTEKYWVYSGQGEAIRQRGLDNSAIVHRINYEWYADLVGAGIQTVSFITEPNLLEESYYYKDGFKYSLTTANQDFRGVLSFYLDMPQRQEVNAGTIINYSGFRIVPKFNAEDILENDRISRVAWSDDDGQDLKEKDIKLEVKTYKIIVDNGVATIPDSSKIKEFKVKNLSPILSQLDPSVADTAIVHSISCYFVK